MKKRLISLRSFFLILGPILILSACSLGGCGKSEKAFQISPAGGEYKLNKNLSMVVPANAVDREMEITIREIGEEEVNALTLLSEDEEFELLAAFEVLPHGQTFSSPVQIRLEGIDPQEGSLPLIYALDLENQTFQLAGARSDFDPEAGELVLYLDHFSSYAEYRRKGYITEECIQDPCRCGSITVEQSDSYNICSQDDCQVTETDVKVTYNECGGNTDHLVMREISESCQPRMSISPEQAVIPVESSTAVNVELGLSCAPFKDQDVFYTADQLGQVNPLQSLTNSSGETHTTFTAGDQEGIAEVTAEAFGSYYLLEITMNNQSEHGIEKFYELEESTTIEIGGIRGTFEAQFNDCNGMVCLNNYDVIMTFSVGEIDWENGSWTGIANISQSGNVTPVPEGWLIKDFTIVERGDIPFTGNANQATGELDLWDAGNINWPSLNEEYVYFSFVVEDATGADFIVLPGNVAGFIKDHIGLEQIVPFSFKVDGSDTPQQGDCFVIINGEEPFLTGTYSLSLEY